MQIIVKRMTLSDLLLNTFYRCRYRFYKKFWKRKLKDFSPKDKPGRELVFEDDFDQVSWSRKSTDMWRKWGIGEHWGWFHPRNGRSWWTEPVFNGDSTISCVTKPEPKTFHRKEEGGYWYAAPVNFEPVETKVVPYSAGGLSTGHNDKDWNTLFKQQYGRWECRCRVPIVDGVRSAYWMWGSTWPPEIDVFEIDGHDNDQYINLHYGSNELGNKSSMRAWNSGSLRPYEWQEFVLEWTPKKIKLITDGITVFRFTNKKTLEWFNKENVQMWVLVYQSVIWDEIPEPDEDGVISSFDVDYVRVYK